jgi:hypothetical protein
MSEKRAALRPPVLNFHKLKRCHKLIEVSFGPGRRAVPPPRWLDVLQVPEEPGGRRLAEAAPAVPRRAAELGGRRPPEVAPTAELLVSQRRPEVG